MKNRVESVFVDLFYIKACLLLYVISGDDEVLESCKEGGVKHFKYEELDIGFFVPLKQGNDPSLSGMSAKSIRAKDQ